MTEAEPCDRCGKPTTQRIGDRPICSGSCDGDPDVYECPYPDCDWQTESHGCNLSEAKKGVEIRMHRKHEH